MINIEFGVRRPNMTMILDKPLNFMKLLFTYLWNSDNNFLLYYPMYVKGMYKHKQSV